MDVTTVVGIALGVASFAIVFALIFFTVRIHRQSGPRQRRFLRGALAAAFIVSASQVAASNGGYAAAFPVVFAGWVLIVCLVFAAANLVANRRHSTGRGS